MAKLTDSAQTFSAPIPFSYKSDKDRKVLGKELLKKLVERTDKGIGVIPIGNGRFKDKPFDEYSDSYKASKDYKIAGKTGIVDLQLTGDMINTIDIINVGEGFITFGFDDDKDNTKALWQQDNKKEGYPKRIFMGMSDSDIADVVKKNPPPQELSEDELVIRDKEIDVDTVKESLLDSIFAKWGL